MAVTTTNVSDTFTGDGVTFGPFPYTFDNQLASDIQIYLGGVLQTSGYSITPNTNPDGSTAAGGNVQFVKAPGAGVAGVIQRAIPVTQDLNLGVEQALNEVSLTNTLDRIVMMIQERTAQIGAALSVPLQILAQGFSLIIQGIKPLYLLRVNAAGNGIEAVSAAQALAQSSPTPGGGTVVNVNGAPLTHAGFLAFAADTTGTIIDYLDDTGAANGDVLTKVAAGSYSFQNPSALVLSPLKANLLSAPGRQLPTSGAWSGTYTHFGNWVQTGNITCTGVVKVFINGTFTQVDPWTITLGVATPGFAFTALANTGSLNGAGPGGGQAYSGALSDACAGGGGGNGGVGGVAFGLGTAVRSYPGQPYSWRSFFGGSGGAWGCPSTASGGTGLFNGGGGGQALYLETTGDITFSGVTVGAITGKGGNGAASTTATATLSTAGGGGSGASLVVRTAGSIIGGNGANCIVLDGGNGGGAGAPTVYGGGGGGGGQFDAAANGTIAAIGVTVNGGTGGTGTTNSGNSGQVGTITTLQNTTVISEF